MADRLEIPQPIQTNPGPPPSIPHPSPAFYPILPQISTTSLPSLSDPVQRSAGRDGFHVNSSLRVSDSVLSFSPGPVLFLWSRSPLVLSSSSGLVFLWSCPPTLASFSPGLSSYSGPILRARSRSPGCRRWQFISRLVASLSLSFLFSPSSFSLFSSFVPFSLLWTVLSLVLPTLTVIVSPTCLLLLLRFFHHFCFLFLFFVYLLRNILSIFPNSCPSVFLFLSISLLVLVFLLFSCCSSSLLRSFSFFSSLTQLCCFLLISRLILNPSSSLILSSFRFPY